MVVVLEAEVQIQFIDDNDNNNNAFPSIKNCAFILIVSLVLSKGGPRGRGAPRGRGGGGGGRR